MEQAANTKQVNFSMSAREKAVYKTTIKNMPTTFPQLQPMPFWLRWEWGC